MASFGAIRFAYWRPTSATYAGLNVVFVRGVAGAATFIAKGDAWRRAVHAALQAFV